MRARVVIQQALARFAYKASTKGTQTQLNALANKLDSTLGSPGGSEENPPPTQGSVLVENQSTKFQAMKQETGAAAAQVDGNMLVQLVGVGAGVFPHYLGAGDAFKLATTTAMEAPMLRQFENFRQLLHNMYEADFAFLLAAEGIDATVEVDSQDIVPEQVAAVVEALDKVLGHFPRFTESESVQKRALNTLGIDDAKAVLAELGEESAAPVAESAQTRAILHRFLRMLQEAKGGTVGCETDINCGDE